MNWDHIEESWDQFKESVQIKWSKLTANDLEIIAGNREYLTSALQRSYGKSKRQAEQEISTWQEQQNEAAYLIQRATERNGAPQ